VTANGPAFLLRITSASALNDHRVRSSGHDLGRPIAALRQIRDGVFTGVRWDNGAGPQDPYPRYVPARSVSEALVLWAKHLAADAVTPISLPLPGFSRLYGPGSRQRGGRPRRLGVPAGESGAGYIDLDRGGLHFPRRRAAQRRRLPVLRGRGRRHVRDDRRRGDDPGDAAPGPHPQHRRVPVQHVDPPGVGVDRRHRGLRLTGGGGADGHLAPAAVIPVMGGPSTLERAATARCPITMTHGRTLPRHR
jgi:hypothetical protein